MQAARSVNALRAYLKKNWALDEGEMAVPGTAPLRGFATYPLTAQEHDPKVQYRNTLPCPQSRVENVLQAIPGLAVVAREATQLAEAFAAKRGEGVDLKLHNFHILRQSEDTASGSSFDYHVDQKDVSLGPLDVSVSVKLTQDPPEGSGSWMQMQGGEAEPYGKKAGSCIVFKSKAMHRSIATTQDMGTVLKVVFFFEVSGGSTLSV